MPGSGSRDETSTGGGIPRLLDDLDKSDIEVGPATAVEVGQVLEGRYRIDAMLGSGGMADVFDAYDLNLRARVAVKVMFPRLARDPIIDERFVREARSASRLDHPNCLRVTDFGVTKRGVKYMVMPILEGASLRADFGAALPPVDAAELMVQILAGLEHAHARGIVHRDLKPENVFRTRDHDGRQIVKIMDFGLAKIVADADGTPASDAARKILGTPKYMSPEQATGRPVDGRSDLYSVGVMLYEALAGSPPFDVADMMAMLQLHVSSEPPALPTSVPSSLVDVVAKLLSKSPDDRPASAKEVRSVIERAIPRLAKPARSLAERAPDPGHGVGGHVAHTGPAAEQPVSPPSVVLPAKPLRSDDGVAGLRGTIATGTRSGSRAFGSRPVQLVMMLALVPAYQARPELVAGAGAAGLAVAVARVGVAWLITVAFGLVLIHLFALARRGSR